MTYEEDFDSPHIPPVVLDLVTPPPPPVIVTPDPKVRRVLASLITAGALFISEDKITAATISSSLGYRKKTPIPRLVQASPNEGEGGSNVVAEEQCVPLPIDKLGETGLKGYCFVTPGWDNQNAVEVGRTDSSTGQIIEIGWVTGNLKNKGTHKTTLHEGSVSLLLSNQNKDPLGQQIYEGSSIELEGEDATSIFTSGTVYAKFIQSEDKNKPLVLIQAVEGVAEVRQKGGRIEKIKEGETGKYPLYYTNPDQSTQFGGCNIVTVGEKTEKAPISGWDLLITGSALIVAGRRKKK